MQVREKVGQLKIHNTPNECDQKQVKGQTHTHFTLQWGNWKSREWEIGWEWKWKLGPGNVNGNLQKKTARAETRRPNDLSLMVILFTN